MRTVPPKTNNGLALWQAFLAGAAYFAAAGVLGDVIGAKWAALALIVNGALSQATGVYITTAKPVETVPATLDAKG